MEIKYIEKMMERFNSGELKRIFGNISRTVLIGLATSGRRAWQEEGGNKKRYQYRKQEEIPVLHWFFKKIRVSPSSSRSSRTQSYWSYFSEHDSGWFFKYIYHVGCTINLHSIINSGLTPWGHLSNRQYSLCLWILWTKNIRIRITLTLKHRVLFGTGKKCGRNKTRCIGLTSNLLKRKDWSSIRHDRTLSFFTIHSQPVVSRKLFGWKLEQSFSRKFMRHLVLLQRFLNHDWMKDLGSEVARQPDGEVMH